VGTPVISFAEDHSFASFADASGSNYSTTSASGWEVVVPASGRLAVRLAGSGGASAIRVSAVPIFS
jgi:hypothetical protein